MAIAITWGTIRRLFWLMPAYHAGKLKNAWPGWACHE
jgi:hypothetical protein